MPDFGRRSSEAELMDEADLSFAEFHHCLQSLKTINQLTLAYRPTLRWLRPWLEGSAPLTILDAGSGGGDMLRRIEKEVARMRGKGGTEQVDLIGVDLNPWSRESAQQSFPDSGARFATGDIFTFEPDRPVDFIISSLFTHHLTDQQLVDFLQWMHGRARQGWFINDLHRHPIPYHFIKAATGLLSRNRLIRNDAAVSVARAFSVADWRRLLARAGLEDEVRIQWFFPFRLCLSCQKRSANQDHEQP